jgi:two-component system, cell cycle sensor histidine kinase and response regulator CckA
LTIVAVSEAYLQATLTKREEILGRALFEVFPDNPDDPGATGVRNLRASLDRVRANRVADTMAVQKYDIRRPDSQGGGFEERFWSPTNSPVLDAAGRLAYIIHRVEDVTDFVRLKQAGSERDKLTDQLRTRAEQMEAEVYLRAQEVAEANRQLRERQERLEQVAAELASAKRESEDRFTKVFHASPVGIAITSESEARFIDVNEAFLNMFGHAREAVVGRTSIDIGLWRDPVDRTRLLERLRTGAASNVTTTLLTKDGRARDVLVSAELIEIAGKACVLSLVHDVTEAKLLEEQLRQAQKMEAVGRLAGGVAHDFNNLLTAMFGYADLLAEGLPAGSHGHENLEGIRRAAERAAALTRQLLAFSRQQVLAPVVLNANSLVEDLDKMLRRLIEEDVDLRLKVSPDTGNVRADPGQLEQVLMNLVVNARDAMPTGGKLLIETANAELTEQYTEMHRPVVAGPYVMLAVSDTGIGMDAETKARIFEPFFTTKEKGRGTGLGLSTVYGIVKQSGGYIWTYSEVGRGTTFKIYLPRVDAPAERVAAPREAMTLTGTETILLAEDDAMLRPLAKKVLQKLGYIVLDAGNPEEALAVARDRQGPIHLLVADVIMPGASGRELARRLAEAHPDTKVLYVSGYTDDAIVHHGMLDPGLAFLQKPFTPDALARKVRQVLDAK